MAIIGEMGVGKTTVGRLLARLLDRRFMDSDEMLEEEFGTTGATFAEVNGVAALHDEELRLFFQMAQAETPVVLAPAASIIEVASARQALSSFSVVWLRASPRVTMERIHRSGHRRTIDYRELKRLRDLRRGFYEDVADYVSETDSKEADEVVAELARELKGLE